MNGVQIVVRFEKNNSVFVNFESAYKKKVEWDSISDEEYENMMKTAILTIEEWRRQYMFGTEVTSDTSTQMSTEGNGKRRRFLRTKDPMAT